LLKLTIETAKLTAHISRHTPWNAIGATTVAVPLLTLVGLEKGRKILMNTIDRIVASAGNKALREASQEIVESGYSHPQAVQQLTLTTELKSEEIDLDSVQPGWNLDKNGNLLKGKILANRRAKVLRELQQ
jgi:hypothetical protein